MNDLNGKCVNVVLAIEMGRGMNYLEHPIKICANFNGRSLESDLVKPGDYHMFNTELVWEIEKKELRKLRSTNVPLRVEVQLVGNNQRKDRIGFILLSVRCATVVPLKSEQEIAFKWQKLLGVLAEKKSCRPELYLSLTIRDLGVLIQQRPLLTELTLEEDTESVDKVTDEDSEMITIEYLEDGFIQIGSKVGCKKFLLSILIQVAYNLDLLLPEALVFNQDRGKYFISFKMFGITIKSKPFCRDLHANIPMNERIVVRILSNYDILKTYLSQCCQITVSFYCGHNKLGITSLPLNALLKHVSFEEILNEKNATTYEQECLFKYPSPNGIVPTGTNNRQPYVEIATTLKRIVDEANAATDQGEDIARVGTLQENNQLELETIEDDASSRSSLENACGDKIENIKLEENTKKPNVTASGDQNRLLSEEEPLEDSTEMPSQTFQTVERVVESRVSTESVTTSLISLSPRYCIKRMEDIPKSIGLYQQYCLDVIIETVILKKKLKSNKLIVKFKHPKASSAINIGSEIENRLGEDILLENTRCKMFFISTTENIRKMVYAWPPKLLLIDENGQNLVEELDIYTAMFLAKNKIECSYTTEVKAVRTYEPLATVSIVMFLQQYGLSAVPQQTDLDLLPPILDETVESTELYELQEWKENEKSQFLSDLTVLQSRRIAETKRTWEKNEMQLEEKLLKGITRCENMSRELQLAVNATEAKSILKTNYNQSAETRPKLPELVSAINKLEFGNLQLKRAISKQKQEMEHTKNTALTKEQTTNLLQQLRSLEEKIGETEKAKTYFKEQWKRAVKEIHDLRSQGQKQIQEKIQNRKTELSQISLESFQNQQDEFDITFPVSFGGIQ